MPFVTSGAQSSTRRAYQDKMDSTGQLFRDPGARHRIPQEASAQLRNARARQESYRDRAERSAAISQSPKNSKNIADAYNQAASRARMQTAITPDNPRHAARGVMEVRQNAMRDRAERSAAISQSPKNPKSIVAEYNRATINARIQGTLPPDHPKHIRAKQSAANDAALKRFLENSSRISQM